MKKFMLFALIALCCISYNSRGFEILEAGSAAEVAEASLKSLEGFRMIAYKDATGTMTIGYGSTNKAVVKKRIITKAAATAQLRADIAACEKTISSAVKVELTVHERAALISFVYNVGGANFRSSTLLKELNSGNYEAVPREMRRWIYSKGKKLRGLINRREKEILLWEYRAE